VPTQAQGIIVLSPKKKNNRISVAKADSANKKKASRPARKHSNQKHGAKASLEVRPASNKTAAKNQKNKASGNTLVVEDMSKVVELLGNKSFLANISTKVGSNAVDILVSLSKSHKTDEALAGQLNVKVNDVRRMLNVMNGYSIVKYDVNKDSKGWLIFTWKIDGEKLGEYISNIDRPSAASAPSFPANCNDFFVCKTCYSTNKTILPFDSAFEVGFRCGCGEMLTIMNRSEVEDLFKEAVSPAQAKVSSVS
jgi:transcription initiation factor IIE alpha subunit